MKPLHAIVLVGAAATILGSCAQPITNSAGAEQSSPRTQFIEATIEYTIIGDTPVSKLAANPELLEARLKVDQYTKEHPAFVGWFGEFSAEMRASGRLDRRKLYDLCDKDKTDWSTTCYWFTDNEIDHPSQRP
jgi:hypothetical protein